MIQLTSNSLPQAAVLHDASTGTEPISTDAHSRLRYSFASKSATAYHRSSSLIAYRALGRVVKGPCGCIRIMMFRFASRFVLGKDCPGRLRHRARALPVRVPATSRELVGTPPGTDVWIPSCLPPTEASHKFGDHHEAILAPHRQCCCLHSTPRRIQTHKVRSQSRQ